MWFPGRPPGRQPPPDGCAEALGSAPLGAWVLYRASPQQVVVTAYHPEVAGVEPRTFAVER